MRPARHHDGKRHLNHVINRRCSSDRRLATLALTHLNRSLFNRKPELHGCRDGLRLGIVVGIALAEELDRPPIAGSETRGGVRDDLASKELDQEAQPRNAHAAHEGGLEAVGLLEEAGADSQIRAGLDEFDKPWDVARVMLAVAVHLDIDVVSEPLRILMPSLNRPTDAQILWEVEHVDAISSTDIQCIVRRTIVHNNVVKPKRANVLDGLQNAVFLIVSRNYNEHARFLSIYDVARLAQCFSF